MNTGKLIFFQITAHLPIYTFQRCVKRYRGNHKIKRFTSLNQYLCMAFAKMTFRESLRDIEACLLAQQSKLYHMGIKSTISRNILANANRVRDWRICADFAQKLISTARRLYWDASFELELQNTTYTLDASSIDLCLSVFPWARFRKTKAAIKLHTLLNLRGNNPSFILTDGKIHNVNVLDILLIEPRSFYVMDRGYLDFAWLNSMHMKNSYFLIQSKSITKFRRLYSSPAHRDSGLICDQTI